MVIINPAQYAENFYESIHNVHMSLSEKKISNLGTKLGEGFEIRAFRLFYHLLSQKLAMVKLTVNYTCKF